MCQGAFRDDHLLQDKQLEFLEAIRNHGGLIDSRPNIPEAQRALWQERLDEEEEDFKRSDFLNFVRHTELGTSVIEPSHFIGADGKVKTQKQCALLPHIKKRKNVFKVLMKSGY